MIIGIKPLINLEFKEYQDEIELAINQNCGVEIEMYSIVANLFREVDYTREKSKRISVRDVSERRKTKESDKYYGESGFPDFIVLERSIKINPKILGCIEIKRYNVPIKKDDKQVKGHSNSFGKVVYTNGLKWIFIGFDKMCYTIDIGKINNEVKIEWYENLWIELISKIKTLEWYSNENIV